MKTSVVLVAAGRGERFKNPVVSKAFFPLNGKPLIAYSLQVFEQVDDVKEIIVVLRSEMMGEAWKSHLKEFHFQKVKCLTLGGVTRADSVWAGLQEVSKGQEIVLVHDAARPLISVDFVERIIRASHEWGGAIPGAQMKSTVKEIDQEGFVVRTHARESLWEAQTPQGFRRELLQAAFEKAGASRAKATDEAFLFEQAGMKVKIVEGDLKNIKITTAEDLTLAEQWLKSGEKE